MKKIAILAVLLAQSAFAQTNLNLAVGNKTAEFGLSHTLESEIIVGGSFSLTNSKVIEQRANAVDRGSCLHRMNSAYTPTLFALVGAKFDRLNILAKVGASYINQNICQIDNSLQTDGTFTRDTKSIYLAIGMQAIYQVSDNVGISGSFDNVNSAMLGINLKIN